MQNSPNIPATLLVVEDNEDMISLLTHFLSREGYKILAARDGIEAVQALQRESEIDLVILDYMLPHMDGLQIVKHIRDDAHWNATPILMLTAQSDERNIVRTLDAGANDYVTKPFRPQELVARVRRLLPS